MRKSLLGQVAASLFALLLLGPLGAKAEGLAGYAQNLCIESGIPLEQCTLMPADSSASVSGETTFDAGAAGTASAKRRKVETLTEHGRALCEEQGVSIEDCLALPAELRVTDQPVDVAAPKRVRPVNIPKGVYQPPQPSRVRQVVRRPLPKAPAYVPPPPPYPVPAYAPAPEVRYAPRPDGYQARVPYYRPPPVAYRPPFLERPREQVFYDVPIVEHYAPPPREYRERVRHLRPDFSEEGRVYYSDRFDDAPRGPRCFRSVRYSSPPSYRYVACD